MRDLIEALLALAVGAVLLELPFRLLERRRRHAEARSRLQATEDVTACIQAEFLLAMRQPVPPEVAEKAARGRARHTRWEEAFGRD